MKLEVYFTPHELTPGEVDRTVVVIDVLRATSTMVEALANGARGVYPVGTTDEAVRLVQNLGRGAALLCGEKRFVRIEGFDLGNSPLEFTAERVAGRMLVMTTTNGTPALQAVVGARRTLVGSLLNLSAVVEAVREEDDVVIVCAGRERRFALEDALCAGLIVEKLGAESENTNDGALAARLLAQEYGDSLEAALRGTVAARLLESLGMAEDVAYCAAVDRHTVVPRLSGRQITLLAE